MNEWLQYSTDKELKLDPSNGYQRRITFQEVEKRYNSKLYLQSQSQERSHLRSIVVSRLTEEEKIKKEEEKKTLSLVCSLSPLIKIFSTDAIAIQFFTKKNNNNNNNKKEELDAKIGFRKILDMIAEFQKPLVGHNLYLDILHTLSMVHYLPDSCNEFKTQLHQFCPMYDLLSSLLPLIANNDTQSG
jgi:poly(A)-specific ribonuclease